MWIEIDGIDGVGKTTQCGLLNDSLSQNGFDCKIVKEIDELNVVGSFIRNTSGLSKLCQMFLILACKSHVLETEIVQFVSKNNFAITDRGFASFLAYHKCCGIRVADDNLVEMLKISMKNWKPDIKILMDAETDIVIERIKEKSSISKFDKEVLENLEIMKNTFLEIANEGDWIIINSNGSKNEIHSRIKKVVFEYMGDR